MLHLFDVGRWMEIIRIEKDPIEFSSDLHSDRRLSGTGYTHENDCLRMVRFHTGMNRLLTWGGSQGDRRQNPEFRSQEPTKRQPCSLLGTDVDLGGPTCVNKTGHSVLRRWSTRSTTAVDT
jgi:hypothetical protein